MFSHPEKNIAQFGIEAGMHVAEFGVGAGYLAVAVAEQVGETGAVYCIDIQKELLTKATHLAQEHHLDILVFIHGDLERPRGSTLSNDSLDAVIMSNILFQVEKKKALLMEAHRVLHKGGKLLLIDWSDSFGGVGPQPEHIVSQEQAKTLAHEIGFTYKKEIDAGAYHYGLIFENL